MHQFWQKFEDGPPPAPPYTDRFPAQLPDGRVLWLPIRPLAGTQNAIASLIVNQASFAVEDCLADILAERLRPFAPSLVVGLPTLGLGLARAVAVRLGHGRFLALGTSRKFWYDPALSVPMSSITSPNAEKRLYLDPRMIPLLQDARIALIDDVVSTGSSLSAGAALLALAGQKPGAIGVAMRQTLRWTSDLTPIAPVIGVFDTPLLHSVAGGWAPAE